MKWVTREKAKADRIACPWLIAHFDDMRIQSPLCDRLYKYCELKTGQPGKLEHSIH
jgi:hypothetical protein